MAHVIGDECVSCGACEAECPVGAISQGADHYEINADSCVDCGACAAQCPTGAISLQNPKANNQELCIGCMRCVSVCPTQARGIGERLNLLTAHLKPLCSDRKENELFI